MLQFVFMFCIILDLSILFHAELALFCIILEKFKGKYNAVIIMLDKPQFTSSDECLHLQNLSLSYLIYL